MKYHKTIVPADKTFFISDTHFFHKNVIRLCNRPFIDINDMHEKMIDNWNAIVPEDGHVFHLGDVGFKGSPAKLRQLLNRLNGNIYLIMGNHEQDATGSECIGRFKWVEKYKAVSINKSDGSFQDIFLCHYSMEVWNKSHAGNVWSLYGHSHGNLPENPNSFKFDVGVDCWNYEPVSFERVAEKMSTKTHIDPQLHKRKNVQEEKEEAKG
jgi:calcineurin-like phosphoesterase family protein